MEAPWYTPLGQAYDNTESSRHSDEIEDEDESLGLDDLLPVCPPVITYRSYRLTAS